MPCVNLITGWILTIEISKICNIDRAEFRSSSFLLRKEKQYEFNRFRAWIPRTSERNVANEKDDN